MFQQKILHLGTCQDFLNKRQYFLPIGKFTFTWPVLCSILQWLSLTLCATKSNNLQVIVTYSKHTWKNSNRCINCDWVTFTPYHNSYLSLQTDGLINQWTNRNKYGWKKWISTANNLSLVGIAALTYHLVKQFLVTK